MDQFYQFISDNSYSDPGDELKVVKIKEALNILDPDYMGEGFNTRVFITKDKKWVIKEGRWDLDLDMFSYGGFKFPQLVANFLMEIFNREFVPKEEVVISQFADYQIFLSYLGHTKREITDKVIHQRQHEIRQNLPVTLKKIRRRFRLKLSDPIIDKLLEIRFENFLPREYLLYGESLSKENDFRPTYYIVQEYVEGKLFHDSQIGSLDEKLLLKLLLLACLILVMYMETGRIPDMRPRYIVNEPMNWFSRTDNIIINHRKIFFVDTRLLWNSKRGPIKRGLLIPEMTILSSRAFINKTSRLIS